MTIPPSPYTTRLGQKQAAAATPNVSVLVKGVNNVSHNRKNTLEVALKTAAQPKTWKCDDFLKASRCAEMDGQTNLSV